MLRLTLELLPYGQEKAKKLLKRIHIVNDGTNDNPIHYADYKVSVYDNAHTEVKPKYKYITRFPREKYDALYLCYLVLRKLVHEHESVDPIDPKAEQDKQASGGHGHSYIQDGSRNVGGAGYGKRGTYGRDRTRHYR